MLLRVIMFLSYEMFVWDLQSSLSYDSWLVVDVNLAGVAIDQGIAYVLMVLALLLTYIIH